MKLDLPAGVDVEIKAFVKSTRNSHGSPNSSSDSKVGMTQVYAADGRAIPVHRPPAGLRGRPAQDQQKDGYEAVQLACRGQKVKHVTKAMGRPLSKRPTSAPCRVAETRNSGARTRRRSATRSRWTSSRPAIRSTWSAPARARACPGVCAAITSAAARRPTLHVPPRARLHRRLGVPVSGHPRDARRRPHGLGSHHAEAPRGGRVDPRTTSSS